MVQLTAKLRSFKPVDYAADARTLMQEAADEIDRLKGLLNEVYSSGAVARPLAVGDKVRYKGGGKFLTVHHRAVGTIFHIAETTATIDTPRKLVAVVSFDPTNDMKDQGIRYEPRSVYLDYLERA